MSRRETKQVGTSAMPALGLRSGVPKPQAIVPYISGTAELVFLFPMPISRDNDITMTIPSIQDGVRLISLSPAGHSAEKMAKLTNYAVYDKRCDSYPPLVVENKGGDNRTIKYSLQRIAVWNSPLIDKVTRITVHLREEEGQPTLQPEWYSGQSDSAALLNYSRHGGLAATVENVPPNVTSRSALAQTNLVKLI